ncbi:SRPBCC domain-containing protein [Microbacterium pumilum]|uniref:Activator of Hsp90 ATPase homologue 1/2-like C-terminal domain-containing protein n=1 Tax=Microbacterium pumilum TaxID=344165 RepID=A0ABN2S888_9MICO
MADHIARVETDIRATPEHVWHLLTQPGSNPDIMFGAEVVSDWLVGSPIRWKGEWEGKSFEDKGEIVEIDPPSRLVVTHFSPMSGDDDVAENYHRLSYELERSDDGTHVTLEQGGNKTADAAEHSSANWQAMLDGLKKAAENP